MSQAPDVNPLDTLRPWLFATDASIYQLAPLAVMAPVDRQAILQISAKAQQAQQPVLARGAGTSLTGQSIGKAVVLDTARHLNRILELNLEEGWVSYGMTIDHLLGLDLALATGEELSLGHLNAAQLAAKQKQTDMKGALYRGIQATVDNLADTIRDRYPKVIRHSGGYALDAFVDAESFNLAKLICGSEGTLGVILEATCKLTPLPRNSALCLAHFSTLDAALRAAEPVVKGGCSAAELIDGVILNQARHHRLTRKVCAVLEGEPAAILVIEVQDNDKEVVEHRIRSIAAALEPYA